MCMCVEGESGIWRVPPDGLQGPLPLGHPMPGIVDLLWCYAVSSESLVKELEETSKFRVGDRVFSIDSAFFLKDENDQNWAPVLDTLKEAAEALSEHLGVTIVEPYTIGHEAVMIWEAGLFNIAFQGIQAEKRGGWYIIPPGRG